MTKKVLKEIIDEKINKNDIYNFVINKRKKNTYRVLKYASLILICALGILFGYKSQEFKNKKDSIINYSNEIYINRVNIFTSKDMNTKLISMENSYIDYDLFSKTFPFYKRSNEAFATDNKILKNYTWDIWCRGSVNEKTEEVIIKNFLYTYKKTDDSGKIVVAFSNTGKPLRDYYFESNTSTYSKIKNKAILIYQYEDTYFTEFKDDNIYYDIESHNVSFEDFKYILEIILV